MSRRNPEGSAVQAPKSADPRKEFPMNHDSGAIDRDLAAAIAVTRFGLSPTDDGWLPGVSRHWRLDGVNPRD